MRASSKNELNRADGEIVTKICIIYKYECWNYLLYKRIVRRINFVPRNSASEGIKSL